MTVERLSSWGVTNAASMVEIGWEPNVLLLETHRHVLENSSVYRERMLSPY